ncbi:GGDEF domain-containing protein [Thalassotalea sediminis]|uniref:GGDEF domain-containing protein n=1 Tax=Thalassotalea sediminis TaxID=1759089 RepID=UPI0025726ACB|nr:GGDEF domain-containing protein [Thalassotalea sediminis]
MNFIRKFEHYLSALYLFTIITLLITSYFTFKEVINSYNKNQHQSIIPLFSIVNTEIIRPLNTAYFMANDPLLIELIEQDNVSQERLLSYLKAMSIRHNIVTFLAIEKHGINIDSTGEVLSLNSDKVEWYYRLKEQNHTQFADIGNAADPHLFFDIKLFNAKDEFLGFAGVAIDLDHFAKAFAQYSERFGFELVFANEKNEVMLSSNYLMKTDSHHRRDEIVNVNDLDWYQSMLENADEKLLNSIVAFTQGDRVVSQMPLQALNWRMYIISPPASEQQEYWTLFLTRIGLFLLVVLVLYSIFIGFLDFFKHKLVASSETDYLTQLPNRSFLTWKFEELACTYNDICVVIADIDYFKQINDQYGHVVGDAVLKEIAKQLENCLRSGDICGRWGGEEFVMLLPDLTSEQAVEIIERLRKSIASFSFSHSSISQPFNITVSFGICQQQSESQSLDNLLQYADKALYKAKSKGRNRTEYFK